MAFEAVTRRNLAVALGAALVLSVSSATVASASSATVASASSAAGQESRAANLASIPVYCTANNKAYAALAAKMVADIRAKIAARPYSTEGIEVTDDQTKMTCWYHSKYHFYAASAVKAIILAALLRKAQESHRGLTANEKYLATLMITQSDNSAASALWNELGIPFIQHFLNLAGMTHTQLAYAWGLSLLTADDEIKLLKLLAYSNTVLTTASRNYQLGLMASVISSQRWGVPYGAPASMVVHVKNGWLPYPGSQWEINSIGAFTRAGSKTVIGRTYLMAILTYNNPSMTYGIDTIQSIAAQIHHDWNTGVPVKPLPTVTPTPTPSPTLSLPPAAPTTSPSDPTSPAGDPGSSPASPAATPIDPTSPPVSPATAAGARHGLS